MHGSCGVCRRRKHQFIKGTGIRETARNLAYSGVKSATAFLAQRAVAHPALKTVIAAATGPLIDIALGHHPEIRARERKKRSKALIVPQ
jgi:hypothetical protein